MDKKELLKMLADEFKAEGLDIAEDAVLRVAKVAFKVAPKIIVATETKLDDVILLPILGVIQEPVFKAIDKIDGKEG